MSDGERLAKYMLGFMLAMAVLAAFSTVAMIVGLGAPVQESTYHGDVVDIQNEAGYVMQVSSVDLKTDPTSSESETFCVHPDNREEVLPDLQRAQENGYRVTISYERPYVVPPWDCGGRSDGLIITDVTVHRGEDA